MMREYSALGPRQPESPGLMRMAQLQATAPIVCCAGMYVESGGFDACDPVFNWVVVTLDGNPIMIVLKGFREVFA